ncbi:MAG: hypothetical protein Q8P67_13340 [archaeon]|nr:hypothetical protein [archaeon]
MSLNTVWVPRVGPRTPPRQSVIQIGKARRRTGKPAGVPRDQRIWLGDAHGTITAVDIHIPVQLSQITAMTSEPFQMKILHKLELGAAVSAMCLSWDHKMWLLAHEAHEDSGADFASSLRVWVGLPSTLMCIDRNHHSVVHSITAHKDATISSIVFLPDTNSLWTAAGGSEVLVWDARQAVLTSTLSTASSLASLLLPIHRDTKVISSSPYGSLIIWDAILLTPLQQIPANIHTDQISSLISCPSSDIVWTCSSDGRVCSWNLRLTTPTEEESQSEELSSHLSSDFFSSPTLERPLEPCGFSSSAEFF